MKWKEEKDKLQKLILTDKLPYMEIGRMYGCSGSNIKKTAERLGIELQSRRKINPKEKNFHTIRQVKTSSVQTSANVISLISHSLRNGRKVKLVGQ